MEAAVVRQDAAFLERVLAPTFVFTHGDGWVTGGAPLKVDSKATWIEWVKRQPAPCWYRDLDPVQVELHGDVAITVGRYFYLPRRWPDIRPPPQSPARVVRARLREAQRPVAAPVAPHHQGAAADRRGSGNALDRAGTCRPCAPVAVASSARFRSPSRTPSYAEECVAMAATLSVVPLARQRLSTRRHLTATEVHWAGAGGYLQRCALTTAFVIAGRRRRATHNASVRRPASFGHQRLARQIAPGAHIRKVIFMWLAEE